jgi:hypothetical protein
MRSMGEVRVLAMERVLRVEKSPSPSLSPNRGRGE